MELPKIDGADAPPEEKRRTERRLARGLEDVSHLFLSQPSDRPAGKGEDPDVSVLQVQAAPAIAAAPFLLSAGTAVNREMLVSLLHRNVAILEEGMRTIDSSVPCDPFGAIDLLAVDGMDRLAIIDIEGVQNNESLLHGMSHFDWLTRNIQIARRMYHGRVINFSAEPRLFLVAPGFSPLVKCIVQRSTNPKICCREYRTAAMSGGVGILFERV
jgi:hypothetical protein